MLYLLIEEFAGEGLAGGGGGGITPSPLGFEITRFDKEGCSEDGFVDTP